MLNTNDLIKNILSDVRVELTEMFDRNFENKGFFDKRWTPRKNTKTKGSLLHVTGKMRRSIRSTIRGKGVHFSSPLPYTELHNKGGKFTKSVRTHTRTHKSGTTHTVRPHSRTTDMPQRQFIGDHPNVQKVIQEIASENITDYFHNLAKTIRK